MENKCSNCGKDVHEYAVLCKDCFDKCGSEYVDPTLFAGGVAEIPDDEAY
jgi:hypothetical protein